MILQSWQASIWIGPVVFLSMWMYRIAFVEVTIFVFLYPEELDLSDELDVRGLDCPIYYFTVLFSLVKLEHGDLAQGFPVKVIVRDLSPFETQRFDIGVDAEPRSIRLYVLVLDGDDYALGRGFSFVFISGFASFPNLFDQVFQCYVLRHSFSLFLNGLKAPMVMASV